MCIWSLALLGGTVVKNLPAKQKIQVQSLNQKDSLEKKVATHSSILAWEIPRRGLVDYSPWDCKGVRHNLATK